MKDTLLPCPFCGNSATFRQWKGQEFIECVNFSCQAQTMPIDIDEMSRREQLSILWNRRVSATPSDGCGKGRTDKERLDWLENTKNSLERAYELDDEAQVMEGFWQVRDVNDCSLSDEENLREAIDKAMEAASSSGEEGGR